MVWMACLCGIPIGEQRRLAPFHSRGCQTRRPVAHMDLSTAAVWLNPGSPGAGPEMSPPAAVAPALPPRAPRHTHSPHSARSSLQCIKAWLAEARGGVRLSPLHSNDRTRYDSFRPLLPDTVPRPLDHRYASSLGLQDHSARFQSCL